MEKDKSGNKERSLGVVAEVQGVDVDWWKGKGITLEVK